LHPRRPHTTVQTSSLPHAVKQLNENPSIEDAFGKKINFNAKSAWPLLERDLATLEPNEDH
jgi:hypothetical protein